LRGRTAEKIFDGARCRENAEAGSPLFPAGFQMCMLMEMQSQGKKHGTLLLAVDACGATGSVALGCFEPQCSHCLLGQRELEGRSFSSTLIASIGELLQEADIRLEELAGIVAVSGPGSFTGVRVGLSAVKGLAEAAELPVVAVTRLEIMTHRNQVEAAALDAHRHEVFLRLGDGRELLAGHEELAALPAAARIAVSDDAAAALLEDAWPGSSILRVPAPTAADALRLGAPRLLAGERADVAALDGHYLRRSDAEIFGDPLRKDAARG
jgi:tRNA threonylcarbamoyladenosine biosynthesis protein TsaB